MTLQLVIWYLLLLSTFYLYLMNVQNFQPGGFQFYDVMMFIISLMAHGHSSFCGTRSNDAVQVPADCYKLFFSSKLVFTMLFFISF